MTLKQRKRKRLTRRIAKARLLAMSEPAGATADTESWRKAIREHPWSAIAVGAGIGLMLGMSPKLRNGVLLSLLHVTR